jgi:hypothetical protein
MSTTSFTITDTLALPNSSIKIPRLGFGIYKSPHDQCVKSCLTALKAGYRHIDSAQYYANEREMGEAVRQSGLKRSDVFLTTKILRSVGSVEQTYQSLLDSVQKIDGPDGYVDLFLIHSSSGGSKDRKELWLALEKLLEAGKTRAIGVSNFGIGHIEELKSFAKVWPPHVNQIEVCTPKLVTPYMPANQLPVATSIFPAAGDCCLLSEARYHCRGLQSAGAKQEGRRSDPQLYRQSSQQDGRTGSCPIRVTKELGSTAKVRYPKQDCRECGCV